MERFGKMFCIKTDFCAQMNWMRTFGYELESVDVDVWVEE
jgi:hypothetical protein